MNVINAVAQFERDLLIERIRPDSPAPKPRANRSGGDRHCHPINNHLPVETKKQRKAAHDFRMFLLDEGFEMGQFSNYLRFCAGILIRLN